MMDAAREHRKQKQPGRQRQAAPSPRAARPRWRETAAAVHVESSSAWPTREPANGLSGRSATFRHELNTIADCQARALLPSEGRASACTVPGHTGP